MMDEISPWQGARLQADFLSDVSWMQRFEKRTDLRIRPQILFFSCFFKFAPGSGREVCALNASFRNTNDAGFSPRFCEAQ
jgi:hypothetical protein